MQNKAPPVSVSEPNFAYFGRKPSVKTLVDRVFTGIWAMVAEKMNEGMRVRIDSGSSQAREFEVS